MGRRHRPTRPAGQRAKSKHAGPQQRLDRRSGRIPSRRQLTGATAGPVSGTTNVGGLVGSAAGGTGISNSYSTSTVSGYFQVGGLVGQAYGGIPIYNSFAGGSVTGALEVGGFAGVSSTALHEILLPAMSSAPAATRLSADSSARIPERSSTPMQADRSPPRRTAHATSAALPATMTGAWPAFTPSARCPLPAPPPSAR